VREAGLALATPPDDAMQAIFDAGTKVGERAHELFPGGVLVDEKPWEHAEAVARTRRLMADALVPAIFEAAFEHEGVRIRVDVLERLPGGAWGLREVKSTSSVKDVHLDDLAVQCFVLEGAGLSVGSSQLIHIDTTYVRGEDDIEWEAFFARADCDAEMVDALRRVTERVSRFHAVLAEPAAPAIEPGFHCRKPYDCEFWDHCTRDKPKDWIRYLPRLQEARFLELSGEGYDRIGELPAEAVLTAMQSRVRDVMQSGDPFVSPDLHAALADAGPPAWYLDFETANPSIPLYAGTRPFEIVPFQWSLHHVDAAGSVTHRDFLAEGNGDPRRAFCESLLEALSADGAPVHVYSAYEDSRLGELADEFPSLSAGLNAIRARLFDQLPLIRQHVYHARFAGSFSIKKVAPALIPTFAWDNLEGITGGSAAAAAWPRLERGEFEAEEASRKREALIAYCARDTLAMVELHRALKEL
jgi:hypothetical protein